MELAGNAGSAVAAAGSGGVGAAAGPTTGGASDGGVGGVGGSVEAGNGGALAGGGAAGGAGAPGLLSPELAFDTTISREVLERYLARSISFTELLHDDLAEARNARGVAPRDNMRLLLSSKAKLVGRALMVWGSEQNLATYLMRAKPYAWQWLAETEPIAHLEMPGSRLLSPGSGGGPRWYWANTKSDACPTGSSTESVIRELWGTGP